LEYEREIGTCYSNPKALIENDSIVEDCLKTCIEKFPNKIEAYLHLCELFHEKNKKDELVKIQKQVKLKFNNNTKFLFQKNFFSIHDNFDFNLHEIRLLIQRKEKQELTTQEIKDLNFFFHYLKSNKSKIEDLEKRKFVDSYFK
jgi:hypothetical protein